MADILGQILIASYRGVEFDFTTTTFSNNHKGVIHTYPGSNRTFYEQTGLDATRISMGLMIGRDDFFEERNRLIAAFELPGKGLLIHPTYGSVQAKVQDFNIPENLTSLGYSEPYVTFIIDTDDVNPEEDANSRSLIDTIGGNSFDEIRSMVASGYLSPDDPIGIKAVAKKLDDISNIVTATSKRIGSYTNQINILNKSLGYFKNNVDSILRTPNTVAVEVTNLLSNVNGLYANPFDQYKATTTLFNFASNETLIKNPSSIRRRINNNLELLNLAVDAAAFTLACQAASRVEFVTNEDILNTQDELEAQWTYFTNVNMPINLSNQIDNLKRTTFQYLDNLGLSDIITVKLPRPMIPEQISLYYYGNLEQAETIANLNQGSFFEGEIKILEIV